MDERDRVITGAALVLLAGGAIAFLALTDRGRNTLRRVGPALDDVSRTLEEVRSIVRKIDGIVQEAHAAVVDLRAAIARDEPSVESEASPQEV